MREWETFKEYPIKTAEEAYNDFLKGRGSYFLPPKQTGYSSKGLGIGITKMYLGYYEHWMNSIQTYLQPVYVIEMESYKAYIPAIKDEYLDHNKFNSSRDFVGIELPEE